VVTPPVVPRPLPEGQHREDRPIEDVVAEGRQIPLRPVYLAGLASLSIATILTVSTGLAPATFLLLWLAPTFVIGALAPPAAGAVAVVVSTALWAFCSHRLGNHTWYLSAFGVLTTQTALAYGANRVVGWMQRRVDRQKALTDDLRRSNAELEHFAYVASHDLAAPLRSVSSFTTMLARRYEGQLDGEADKMIGYITGGTDRMQRMIEDLLAFARAGRVESELERFSLASVVDQVRSDLAVEIRERKADIRSGPLPDLVGDRPRIIQVMQNLIANAIKFTPPDRAPVIEVAAARLPSGWRIDVSDNGIGIDPRYASKAFGMFQRLQGDDDFPGTGIGLAICQRIVERHGGRIWVDGFEGEGSTFSFTIPDQVK
jgi:signal transduction histidine kinase